MWVKVRLGTDCWVFVSAYGPGAEKMEEEQDKFWDELESCVDGLSRNSYVVVLENKFLVTEIPK